MFMMISNCFRPEGIFEKYQLSWKFKMAFSVIKVNAQLLPFITIKLISIFCDHVGWFHDQISIAIINILFMIINILCSNSIHLASWGWVDPGDQVLPLQEGDHCNDCDDHGPRGCPHIMSAAGGGKPNADNCWPGGVELQTNLIRWV